jgi:hypothetical protein
MKIINSGNSGTNKMTVGQGATAKVSVGSEMNPCWEVRVGTGELIFLIDSNIVYSYLVEHDSRFSMDEILGFLMIFKKGDLDNLEESLNEFFTTS